MARKKKELTLDSVIMSEYIRRRLTLYQEAEVTAGCVSDLKTEFKDKGLNVAAVDKGISVAKQKAKAALKDNVAEIPFAEIVEAAEKYISI